jgi:hypothetical protein
MSIIFNFVADVRLAPPHHAAVPVDRAAGGPSRIVPRARQVPRHPHRARPRACPQLLHSEAHGAGQKEVSIP